MKADPDAPVWARAKQLCAGCPVVTSCLEAVEQAGGEGGQEPGIAAQRDRVGRGRPAKLYRRGSAQTIYPPLTRASVREARARS